MLNAKCEPKWADVHYGVPQPRYIRPLVRINAMTEDMPVGYKIDPCFLPPTILQVDECGLQLRVNDAIIDLKPLINCFYVAAGAGAPVAKPSVGYLPFWFDSTTSNLYVYLGGEGPQSWHKVAG